MPKFRKKPVVIEAYQWVPSDLIGAGHVSAWLQLGGADFVLDGLGDGCVVLISTLEGEMRADPNDWIIRGVKGEHYPCKPEIFAATYEAVEVV
jgi:hypothetical protein